MRPAALPRLIVSALALLAGAIAACSATSPSPTSSAADGGFDAGGDGACAGVCIRSVRFGPTGGGCPAGWSFLPTSCNSRNFSCCVAPDGGGASGALCKAAGGRCVAETTCADAAAEVSQSNDCPDPAGSSCCLP